MELLIAAGERQRLRLTKPLLLTPRDPPAKTSRLFYGARRRQQRATVDRVRRASCPCLRPGTWKQLPAVRWAFRLSATSRAALPRGQRHLLASLARGHRAFPDRLRSALPSPQDGWQS